VDRIALVTFPTLDALQKEGHTLFQSPSPENETAADRSEILQGALEGSNVNPIQEMLSLLDSHRTYEACIKIIQSDDTLDSKAVNEVGRV